MSDIATPGLEPAATPEVTAPVTEATAPAAEATPDVFDNAEVQSFDREYVTKLRDEAAKYRTEAKSFKEVFDGYDDASRDVLLNVITTLKTDTDAGVKALKEIISVLSPEEAEKVMEAVEGELQQEEEEEEELTVEQRVEKALAEREAQDKQQREVQSIIDKTTNLGFPPGDPDHITLLWIAKNQTGNDLDAAAAKIAERNQAIIDKYIADKSANNGAFTTPTAGATSVSDNGDRPKTYADARARVEERVAAAARGGDK